jgi:hypothetical protein
MREVNPRKTSQLKLGEVLHVIATLLGPLDYLFWTFAYTFVDSSSISSHR